MNNLQSDKRHNSQIVKNFDFIKWVLFVLLIFSQDITWSLLREFLPNMDIANSMINTCCFLIQGYYGFIYLFTTTLLDDASRKSMHKIISNPIISIIVNCLVDFWYIIKWIIQVILTPPADSKEIKEINHELYENLQKTSDLSSEQRIIRSFGTVFVITLVVYIIVPDFVQHIITGIYSLAAAGVGYVLFVFNFKSAHSHILPSEGVHEIQ